MCAGQLSKQYWAESEACSRMVRVVERWIQHGRTTLNYEHEKQNRKTPVSKWLEMIGKAKHVLKAEQALGAIQAFENEIDHSAA